MNDDCVFEHVSLSDCFSRDGIRIETEIYWPAGTQELWWLKGVDQNGSCTRWHERFATEQGAYRAFITMVKADGIASFTGTKPKLRH